MLKVSAPKDTIKRLFLYYRALLESRKTEYISSEELAELSGSNAPQMRKDISYFGEFGTPGKGYNVDDLRHRIKGILGIDREWEVALIGIGNLGKALLTYNGLKQHGFKITHLFDNAQDKIGRSCAGLLIKDIKNFKEEMEKQDVKIVVLTVPANVAQSVCNILVDAGVKAIFNFAPTRINVPPEVKVLNIDMTSELARLSYYLTQTPTGFDDNHKSDYFLHELGNGNDVY